MERQDLRGHLRDKCPLTVVDCPFHYAGCETQLPCKDMPEHMKETATHLTLLATVTLFVDNQKLLRENQQLTEWVLEREDKSCKCISTVQVSFQELLEENEELNKSTAASLQQLNMKYDSLIAKNKGLSLKNMKPVTELKRSVEKVEKEKKQQYEKQKVRLSLQQRMKTPAWLLEFCVNFTNKEVFFSPAFYTHPYGYRMCVRVHPHGLRAGEGTHVSIFIHMMPGQFDDYLKWLFRGSVVIQLVNQAGDHDHIEMIVSYNDMTPDNYTSRVTGSDIAKYGRGSYQFISHADLGYNAARKAQYLKDNHLIVSVVKVIVL